LLRCEKLAFENSF